MVITGLTRNQFAIKAREFESHRLRQTLVSKGFTRVFIFQNSNLHYTQRKRLLRIKFYEFCFCPSLSSSLSLSSRTPSPLSSNRLFFDYCDAKNECRSTRLFFKIFACTRHSAISQKNHIFSYRTYQEFFVFSSF